MPGSLVRLSALAALAFLLTQGATASADPADLDTALGEIEILEAQIAPDGGRVAFITRRNDFAHDREAFAVWVTGASAPVVLADAGTYGALR
ncbi:MAG TPA: hypothetical protein DD490_30940, partial [Acidobacteria bacterium]|nr:hypothetical protein [Acidobacteriota bacterium]